MFWPRDRRDAPPRVVLPPGYGLRTFRPGDEERWCELMGLCGWADWKPSMLAPWHERLLPEGFYLAIHEATDVIVASAMALTSDGNSAELGWVISDPAHRGHGLGATVSAAATARLLEAGRDPVYLLTDDHRLAALKTYLKMGYVPQIGMDDMPDRWRKVCENLGWEHAEEEWGRRLEAQ